jgi:hypothetical protein
MTKKVKIILKEYTSIFDFVNMQFHKACTCIVLIAGLHVSQRSVRRPVFAVALMQRRLVGIQILTGEVP